MAIQEQLEIRNQILQTAELGTRPAEFNPEPRTYIIASTLRAVGKTELLLGLRPHLIERSVCFLALTGSPRTAYSHSILTIKDWVMSRMSRSIQFHADFWTALRDGNWETLLAWLIEQHQAGLHTLFEEFKKYTWVLLDDVDKSPQWVHLLHLLAIGKPGPVRDPNQQKKKKAWNNGDKKNANSFVYRQYKADKQLCKRTVVMTCRAAFRTSLEKFGSRWQVDVSRWQYLELKQDAFHTPVYRAMLEHLLTGTTTERDMVKWNRCLLQSTGDKTYKILHSKLRAPARPKAGAEKKQKKDEAHAVAIKWQTVKGILLDSERIQLGVGSRVRALTSIANGQVFEGATGTVVDWQVRSVHDRVEWPVVAWDHLAPVLARVGGGEMWVDWDNQCNIGAGCPLALSTDAVDVTGLFLRAEADSGTAKQTAESSSSSQEPPTAALLLTSVDVSREDWSAADAVDILCSVRDVRHVALLGCKLSSSFAFHSAPSDPSSSSSSSSLAGHKRRRRWEEEDQD